MYLAIFLVSILYLYTVWSRGKGMLSFGVVGALIVLFPATNALILLLFQHFYGYEESMWILPIYAIAAYAVTELYGSISTSGKKALLVPVMCIVFLLCGWMAFDGDGEELQTQIVNATAIDEEYIEVYDYILEHEDESPTGSPVVMAAPRELMEYARMYNAGIGLAYGRDIWETDLDYAFYEPNEDEAYDLAEKMEEEIGSHYNLLVKELNELGVNYLVLNKDNLVYDEEMQYPERFKNTNASYRRMYETRHYVIYVKER